MLSTAVIALALALHGPAIPELADAGAREHARKGLEHFDAGELAEAAAELAAAYAIEPNPTLLAARAKVEHARGDCEEAVTLFREYLDTDPPAAAAAAARGYIDDCGGDVLPPPVDPDSGAAADDSRPVPPPRPADDATSSPPAPVDRPNADAPPPVWKDRVGGALVGSGGVLLALGVGLLAGAYVTRDRAESASHQRYVEGIGRAIVLERAAISSISVGGALLLGGTLRYALLARKRRDRRR